MKRIKVLFAALLATLAFMTASAQEDDANAKYNKAAELIGQTKYAEAIVHLKAAINQGLDAGADYLETVQSAQKLLPVCYFRNGLGLAKANKYDEALVEFNQAMETGELYNDLVTTRNAGTMISKIYSNMAADAFNNKDYEKAIEIFSKGYEANPNDTQLGLNLATAYCEVGDSKDMPDQTEKGIEIYKQIISLKDKNSKYEADAKTAQEKIVYYTTLSAVKAGANKDYRKVLSEVDKILAYEPKDKTALMLRIQTYTNLKDWDKVIEFGDASAEAQSDASLKSDAYFYLGAAYQNKDNKAKAVETYKKVVAGNNVATAKAQITALSK